MAVIMSKIFTLPSSGISGTLLSDLTEGSIVLIPENGVNAEFYIAKHDYESGLNGAGRTLLLRRDTYGSSVFGSTNTYANSTVNSILNNEYKALFTSEIQDLIGETKFYYTPGDADYNVTTLSRSVFLLSATEFGAPENETIYNGYRTEGTALPTASIIIYDSTPTIVMQYTRTPMYTTGSSRYIIVLNTNGEFPSFYYNQSVPYRPAFTLPSNAVFDPTTKEFKGVA